MTRIYIPISRLTPEQLDIRRQKECERRRRQRAADPEAERARGRNQYARDPERYNRRKKAWHEANPEKTREIKKRYVRESRAKYIVQSVRSEAKQKGVKFDISIDWVAERLSRGVCELSGLPFNMTEGRSIKDRPSIDRVIPGGDYVENNCRLILFRLNSILGSSCDVPRALARLHELREA